MGGPPGRRPGRQAMTAAEVALWRTVPAAAGRASATAACALADGSYLLRWPRAAVAVPAGGLILGLVLGAIHPGPSYSYSFAVVAAMAAGSAIGAGVGAWILLGFVGTDLFLSDRSQLQAFAGIPGINPLTQAYVPLALTYLLLGILLVLVPLAGSAFAFLTAAALREARPGPAELAASLMYVGTVTALTYAWGQAMPFMIRPLYSFALSSPDTPAIEPIQANIGALCAVAAMCAAGRCLLMRCRAGSARWPPLAPPGLRSAAGGRRALVRALVAVPFQALLLALLLGGLVSRGWQGWLIWLLLCAIIGARLILVPLIPGYPELIAKVPVLFRIGACVLAGYLLGAVIAQRAVVEGQTSFAPLLQAVFGALVMAALLLPGPQWRASGPGGPGGTTSAHLRGPGRGDRPPAGPGRQPASFFSAARWLRLARVLLVVCIAQVVFPGPAALADNCGDLSDCSAGAKVALVVCAIVGVAILIVLLPEIVAPVIEPLAGAIAAQEAAAAGAIAAGVEIAGVDPGAVADAAASELVSAAATIAEGISPKFAPILTAIDDAFSAAPTTNAWDALAMVGRAVASVGFEPGTMLGQTAAGSFVFVHPAGVVSFMFANGQVLVMQGPRTVLNLIP